MFEGEGGIMNLARSYNKFGLHLQENNDIVYTEWAPSARQVSLVSVSGKYMFSLAISMNGIEIHIKHQGMSLECGV